MFRASLATQTVSHVLAALREQGKTGKLTVHLSSSIFKKQCSLTYLFWSILKFTIGRMRTGYLSALLRVLMVPLNCRK